MAKFGIDLTKVNDVVNPDKNKLPVQGNEHRMVKVAFDVFRLKGDETDDLWQVQADDDGEFLVRTNKYLDTINDEERAKLAKEWSISIDKKGENLTIAYSNDPIKRIASAQYGANSYNDVITLKQTLLEKLASENFVSKLVSSLPKEKQDYLQSKYSKFANLTNRIEWWKSGPLSGKFKAMVDKASNLSQIEMIKRRFLDSRQGDLYNTFVNEVYSITEPQEYLEGKALKLKNTPKRKVEMGGEADIQFHGDSKPKMDPIKGIPSDKEHADFMKQVDRGLKRASVKTASNILKQFKAHVDNAKSLQELDGIAKDYLYDGGIYHNQLFNVVKDSLPLQRYWGRKEMMLKSKPAPQKFQGNLSHRDKAPQISSDPIQGIPSEKDHAEFLDKIDRGLKADDGVKEAEASVKLPGDVAGIAVAPAPAPEKNVQNIKVVYEKKGRNMTATWEGQALIPSGVGTDEQSALKDLFRKLSKM